MDAAVSRQETREAILWDVLPLQNVCRVKIQGSNELIVAHYPQNWDKEPFWLKKGTSLCIRHIGGDRGWIEVAGLGRAIPTPISGDMFPTLEVGIDGVITNCYVTSCPNNNRMAVLIHVGTYRISGVTYALTPITMADGANYMLGDGGTIGDIAGIKLISVAPAAGLFRYDLISVGVDGVIDYTAGTPAAIPTKPTVGSSHIELGYILVPGATTAITDMMVGHEWTTPAPYSMTMTIADKDMLWADPASTTVTLQILDQYGNPYVNNLYFTLEIISGNGTLYSLNSGSSTTKVEQGVYGSSYAFTYTRDKIDPGDSSPMIKGSVIGSFSVDLYDFIKLRNAAGNVMPVPVP